jgi:hypothetical protein
MAKSSLRLEYPVANLRMHLTRYSGLVMRIVDAIENPLPAPPHWHNFLNG